MIRIRFFTASALLVVAITTAAQSQLATVQIQLKLDSMRVSGRFPGLSVAIAGPGNTVASFVSGYADSALRIPLTANGRLLQGSVGKTYASALALQLLDEGNFKLDDRVALYLGKNDWYRRLPNADSVTIRHLMTHTSGIMRYEFKPQFTTDLTNNPSKVWKPEDLLTYVFDEKPAFAAGKGWEYSDTNYILLAMIIEKVTGKKYYDLLQQRILNPLKLVNTFPSDRRKLPGLVQGYAGKNNEFGGKEQVIGPDGQFIVNPQFEWTGGGIYSTTADLAHWGKLLYEGKAFNPSLLPLLQTGTPARGLGRDVSYGLGVIIRKSPALGTYFGHSGFFPGYMTEMYYFPDCKTAVAVQTNSSDYRSFKGSALRVLTELAALICGTK